MDGFNDNHKRRLTTMFQSVDDMLTEVVRLLDPSQAQSPFSQHLPDATPVQHRVVEDYVARIRARMRRVLDGCGVALPEPHVSSVWAARTTLTSADIAVEELRPQYMRGYGELSESTERELELVVSELLDLITRMEAYLAQGSGRDLGARLKRLERTNNAVPLLQELDRVITEHGLLAFRPTLAMLLERFESNQFEIAVFGRVSSGKSSLLNHILQTDVLPVGVTPVTAVPTRVSFGATPHAVVSFAEADPLGIEPHRLAEFVTEQENPSNAKHVTRVHVAIPAVRLKEGVTFVNTPGLGSLAEAGTAESLAYLPRCDLGIVLVDASSTLIHEDIALVNALYQAGADVMVLLSKADMLAAEDHERALDYAHRQLQSNIGIDVPVYLVSIKGAEARLCDRWFDDVLVPRLREHLALATAAFQRKVGGLRESVVAALKRRAAPGAAVPVQGGNSPEQTNRVLSVALMRLDAARRKGADAIERPAELSGEIIDQIARDGAAYWKENPDAAGDAREITTAAIARSAGAIAERVAKELLGVRSLLADTLAQARRSAPPADGPSHDLSSPAGMPALDASEVVACLHVHRPALGFLGTGVASHGIHNQLDGSISKVLSDTLYRYGKRLDEWRSQYLRELRQTFTAAAELYRASPDHDRPAQSDGTPAVPSGLQRDIERLERYAAAMARDEPHEVKSGALVSIVSALAVAISAATLTADKLQERHWLRTPPLAVLEDSYSFGWAAGGANLWKARTGHATEQVVHVPGWALIGFADCVLSFALHMQHRPTHQRRCHVCGYDLRATPIRCPECGTDAVSPASVASVCCSKLEIPNMSKAMRVLLIDNSEQPRRSIADLLRKRGYSVDMADDGEEGLRLALAEKYDAVVIEMTLPKIDGLHVVRRLRQEGHEVGILFFSARYDVTDRLEGLHAGADDYISKGVIVEELLARIAAVIRRTQSFTIQPQGGQA